MIFICELEGFELDREIGLLEGFLPDPHDRNVLWDGPKRIDVRQWSPSTDRRVAKPIFEREDVETHSFGHIEGYYALVWTNPVTRDDVADGVGPTRLLAGMRALLKRAHGITLPG